MDSPPALKHLYLFNPETDYALASGQSYTPPANIVMLRKRLALLPALYAVEGSAILLMDEQENPEACVYYEQVKEKGISLVTPEQLKHLKFDKISPWGWNRSLVSYLRRHGCEPRLLPSEESLQQLEVLAHRRSSIEFQKLFYDQVSSKEGFAYNYPIEVCSLEDFDDLLKSGVKYIAKAPHSSAGRGVFALSSPVSEPEMARLKGIIRSQGSVIIEQLLPGTLDFATEWEVEADKVQFKGLSVFATEPGGGYRNNRIASREELDGIIAANSAYWCPEIIEAQAKVLVSLALGKYVGPVGIDMLVTADGTICPCIELNFRMTMGRAFMI